MTPLKIKSMTGKGTTRRTIRISDEEWLPALAKAEAEGTNLSEVVRKALMNYVLNNKEAKG